LAILENAEVESVCRHTAREHCANPSPEPEHALPAHQLHHPPPRHGLGALAHALHVGLEGVHRVHDGVLRDPRDRARHHVVQKVALGRVPVFPVFVEIGRRSGHGSALRHLWLSPIIACTQPFCPSPSLS
ncbi:unnamed protein product, partial [Ectocarpus sp. 4 AP-2014]